MTLKLGISWAELLATYLDRSDILSIGKGRGREQVQNYRRALLMAQLVELWPDNDNPIDEAQLAKLERSLDSFRHPRQPRSLRAYLVKAHPRIMPTPSKFPGDLGGIAD